MHDSPIKFNPATEEESFGYEIMGPILAECCWLLHQDLTARVNRDNACALFCSRGGLIIRRAYEHFLDYIDSTPPMAINDFMVSRLAASRLPFSQCRGDIAPLLALEFEGRDCAAVASALSGEQAPGTAQWSQPYSLKLLDQLLTTTETGRELNDRILTQSSLLQRHFNSLVVNRAQVIIVDTGVFGSIGHYLQLGLPTMDLRSVLLFRANYKRSADSHFPKAEGLICDNERYRPWAPRSVSRLYWPLIEAFFEPDLPSVQTYVTEPSGRVVSNLEISRWEQELIPVAGTARAGAFAYLSSLTAASTDTISSNATTAWRSLRTKIVYPTRADVRLLGVQQRALDFGSDDTVSFTHSSEKNSTTLSEKRGLVRESVWPEGTVRLMFPRTGGLWLRLMEYKRALFAAFALGRTFRN